MRHQVERLKHVALKHGVKPARALTATLVAVGMMVTGSVVLGSSTANADGGHNNGAICTPKSVSLGTGTGVGTEDTGIATYAGGDMYVGQKVSGDMNNTSGPTGSYAAEAEGLTAVNGKLLMHPLKGLWTSYYTDGTRNGYIKDYKGFRFGIVGFGGQYRPKTGSSTLEVRGNSSDSSIDWVGGAQSWGNAGWIGQTKPTEPNYTANIAGDQTMVYGGSSNDILGNGSSNTNKYKYNDRASVYVPDGTRGTVNWQQNDNQIGSTGETFDGFGSYIKTLSGNLSNLSKQQSESVYVAAAKTTTDSEYYNDLVRAKFDGTYSFKISSVHEKIIEFVGNGTSSMQVFNLPANMLNDSSSYTGVSFSFKKIPDTSSVVINVTGGKVDFHNGWRFWWTDMNNTTKELGGSYTDGDYAKRAQQIMWNFADASSVTIRGGQGSGTTTRKDANSAAEKADGVWDGSFPLTTKDDPAAGMLGSILVPNGSFESHVSTNGRVWVGGNYAMYNPEAVGNTGQDGKFYEFVNYERSHSASALDMDQERHNLPWNGSYSTSCAAIKWDKVDAAGTALKGTSWTVYGTKDNAVSGTNPITTVADGGWNDADNADNGSVTLGSLAKNATYYVRESGTGSSQYALNTNIYRIVTQDSTDTVSTIDKVYTAAGAEITDDTAKQLHNGAIVNVSAGTSIAWSKVDAEDQNALLAGSTWELTKKGNPDQSWTITDDDSDSEIANIVVKINGTEASSWNFTNSTPVSISYVAVDKNGKELATKVQWKSESPAVAGIASDGTQLQPYSDGTTNIVFTAGDKTLTFPVAVNGVTVESRISIEGYTEGQEISLEQGKTMTLKATVAPEGNTVNWSSSNTDDVSVSPSTGTAVTVTAKNATSSYVTIIATEQRGEKKASLKIKVTEPMVSVYFKKSNVQWNNYWLKYKKSTDGTGWSGDVQSSSACGDYVRFQLPKSSVATGYEFYLGNAQGWNLTANNIYQAVNKSNFRFTGNSVQVVETYNNYQGSTVPSGCTATSAYVENRSRRSAVKNAVFYDQPVVRAITNTTAKAAGTLPDEDPKAGQLKVSNLTDDTYTLKETSAPNGFDASKARTYTIVIKNGQIEHSDLPGKVENPRLTGKVTWRKTAENTSELLSGSEWKLYKTKNFTWNNGNAEYAEGDSITPIAIITDCVNSSEKTCSAQTEQYTDRNGEAGKFELVGLAWGEYQLVESKAPDGFNLDSTPHMFRIGPAESSDVTGKWYTSNGFKTDSTGAYNANMAFTVDGGSITNTPGVVLPGTGGEGLNKMYAAGFLAVAIAVAGLALSLRRRQ
ncbi:SpaA isopeptide-forming pilin-related protein [Bifidobacterium angulatum]|uniref:SpaA isopeptide-forming pilin-related protein n=3 Tax=Bifidobacterium angulatum TaxID=1683 RepID=UPI00321B6F0E